MTILRLTRLAALLLALLGWRTWAEGPDGGPPPPESPAAARAAAPAPAVEDHGRVPIPGRPAPPPPAAEAVVAEAPPAAATPEAIPAADPDPIPASLALADADAWRAGRALFARRWTAEDGLGGPGFNAESCGTCHRDPVVGGAGDQDFNVLRIRGVPGYESGIPSTESEIRGLAQLRKCREGLCELRDKGQGHVLAGLVVELQTPSIRGAGRIDRIPDEAILAREDPDDADGDGVRGVARRVAVNGAEEVGRFGWKAGVPRLADFGCLALGGETGLTVPDQGRGFGLTRDRDRTSDPEVSQAELDRLVVFMTHLPAPERGADRNSREARTGERLFAAVGCAACHVPTLQAADGPVHLWSDLLLHEVLPEPEPDAEVARQMRRGLERGRRRKRDAEPEPRGFRTPPLWGVARTAPYLHDGRAATLDAAIRAHAGEAASAQRLYASLREADRRALLAFLETL